MYTVYVHSVCIKIAKINGMLSDFSIRAYLITVLLIAICEMWCGALPLESYLLSCPCM